MSDDLVEASGRVLDAAVAAMGGVTREGQASMVSEGAAALEDRTHLLVQAGTGTGKSLGYLVPLLTHCATRGVRGVVRPLRCSARFSSRMRPWRSMRSRR